MEQHSLALKIDASAAEAGSKRFRAALEAVRKSVNELERDTDGAFTKLRGSANLNLSPKVDKTGVKTLEQYAAAQAKIAANAARRPDNTEARTQLAVAAALRVSQREASYLAKQLDAVGDASGVARLNAELARLKTNLAGASTPLDVRAARSGYSDTVAGLREQANQLDIVQRSSRLAAVEADRLRTAYVPLYVESQRYAQALEEINRAEQQGIVSAQAASAARERAAQSLLATSTASQGFTKAAHGNAAAISNVSAQFQDVAVMMAAGQNPFQLALQQGTQLSAVLNQMGGRTAILRTLASGFMQMVNPVSLVTIGVIAAGAAIVNWMSSSETATMSFGEALNDADSKISALSRSTETLANAKLGSLAKGYGQVNEELRIHLERLSQIAQLEAVTATRQTISALESSMTGGWLTSPVDDIRIALDTTNDGARHFLGLLNQIKQAKTFEEQVGAIKTAREYLESTGVTLDSATGSAQEMLFGLVRAEDSALRLKRAAAESDSALAGATSQTSAWAAAMTGVGAEINAILSSLSTIGGSVISNAAKRAESSVLAAGGAVRASEVARLRYQHEAEMRAKEMGAGDGVSGLINHQLIAAERYQFEEGIRLDDELNALREAARKRETAVTRGGRGGGVKKDDATKLAEDMKERLVALSAERFVLEQLGQEYFRTADAEKLYIDAMTKGNGVVSASTLATLQAIDAAAAYNEELRKLANDPLKDWLEAVPTWVEGARSIEMAMTEGLQTSFEGVFKGEGADIKGLVDKIRSQMASVLAQQTLKIGMDAFGIKGSLFGGGKEAAAIQLAGTASAAAMQTGIVTGGMQAAQMMQAAMSGAALGGMPAMPAAGGGGGGGGFFGVIGGLLSGFFSEGGYSDRPAMSSAVMSPAMFRHAPHFKEGTANTSGIPAVLHPNEAVIPLSKGRKIPVDLGDAGRGERQGPASVSVAVSNTITVSGDEADVGGAVTEKIVKSLSDTLELRIRSVIADEVSYGGVLNPRG